MFQLLAYCRSLIGNYPEDDPNSELISVEFKVLRRNNSRVPARHRSKYIKVHLVNCNLLEATLLSKCN